MWSQQVDRITSSLSAKRTARTASANRSSETHLQNQLEHAIGFAVRDDRGRGRCALRLAAGGAEIRRQDAGGAHAGGAELPEIGVVKKVECFSAEGDFDPLGGGEALRDSAVHVPEARALEHVSAHASTAPGGHSETAGAADEDGI